MAKILVEEIVTRYGVPIYIHSDQGSQFESALFQEMCRLLGIRKTRTTPYHPKSDGMVERFNRTLVTMLSGYVNEHQSDWDVYIPYVMMAYRSARQETTGYTPNKLMFGRETATPLDIQYEMPSAIMRIPHNKWIWELQERMEEAHNILRRYVGTEMVRQKKCHDQKLSWEEFREGDSVYVYFPTKKVGLSKKFVSFWRGPYKVLKKISDLTYEVDCGQNGTPQVIHVDRIRKRYEQQLLDEPMPDEEESEESNGEDDVVGPSDLHDCSEIESEHEVAVTAHGRQRRPPRWLSDYVQY